VCEDKSIQSWNVVFTQGQPLPPDFGKPLQSYAHAAAVTDVTFSPDGAFFYTGSADKTARQWKLASEAPVRNFPHPALVDAVAFCPNAPILATGCHDGKVRLFDLAKGAPLREINAHVTPQPAPIYCVAWSPDGKTVVSGSLDHTLKLWDAASGAAVREFKAYKEKEFDKGHREGVFCAAFSPDGKYLASGSSDRTIKLWTVADGNVARELVNPNLKAAPGDPAPSHPGWVYGVRFTPDGKQLISAGGAPKNMGALALWNVEDGKLLASEELPTGSLFGLALSADGKLIAVGTAGAARPGAADLNVSYVLKAPAAK
jgi:WD40 repeat protein